MSGEELSNVPVIKEMPVVSPKVWEQLQKERREGGDLFYWSLASSLARNNQEHREPLEKALRKPPPETPDATGATVLLVLRALEMQAHEEGYQLPPIPSPINPLPALREFIRWGDGTEHTLIGLAYQVMVRANPVIGDIVESIGVGAPDELLRIMSITQAKRGAVYALYGVKSAIPKVE